MSIRRLSVAACAGAAVITASAANADVTSIQDSKVHGDGPINLVLVPGFASDLTVWDSFQERNEERYTMHAVTLPGFSGTPAPEVQPDNGGTPMFDNALDALAEYIEDNNIQNAVVIGHSLGGTLAMRLAIEHPDKVSKVITLDGMPAMPLGQELELEMRRMVVNQQIAPQLRSVNDEQWNMQLSQMFSPMFHDQAAAREAVEMAQKTEREVAVEYLLDLLKTDVRPGLTAHRAPLLAVAAINADAQPGMDPEQTRGMWGQMLAGAPELQIVLFEGTAHFIMAHRPEALDKAVASFTENGTVSDFTPDE